MQAYDMQTFVPAFFKLACFLRFICVVEIISSSFLFVADILLVCVYCF